MPRYGLQRCQVWVGAMQGPGLHNPQDSKQSKRARCQPLPNFREIAVSEHREVHQGFTYVSKLNKGDPTSQSSEGGSVNGSNVRCDGPPPVNAPAPLLRASADERGPPRPPLRASLLLPRRPPASSYPASLELSILAQMRSVSMGSSRGLVELTCSIRLSQGAPVSVARPSIARPAWRAKYEP